MWQRGVGVLRRVWGDWRGQMHRGKRAGRLSGRLREGGRRGWRESSLREGGHSASVHRVTLKSAPSLAWRVASRGTTRQVACLGGWQESCLSLSSHLPGRVGAGQDGGGGGGDVNHTPLCNEKS